jgi:hypothetical protein
MKAKDGVYNLMKEKREQLHDGGDGDLKDSIEYVLFDLGNRSQEVDVSLNDDIGENGGPRRKDQMENDFITEIGEEAHKFIENEEKEEVEDFDASVVSSQIAK